MKTKTLITIVLGVAIVVAAAAMVGMHNRRQYYAYAPPRRPLKTTTDVLEKFDALKDESQRVGRLVRGSRHADHKRRRDRHGISYTCHSRRARPRTWFRQGIRRYIPPLIRRTRCSWASSTLPKRSTTQQYKVDVYALERPLVELYADGSITKSELLKKALLVTPETQDLRTTNVTISDGHADPDAGQELHPTGRQAGLPDRKPEQVRL